MAATVAVAMLLTGCGGSGASEPPPTPSPEPTAVPTATPVPMSLSGVTWTTGIDPSTREPKDSVQQFPSTAPAIIAAVQVEHAPEGAELTATWSIDGVEVPDTTMVVTTQTALVSGWATFRFTREEGHRFPLGDLSVTISAEDGSSVSSTVDIVIPDE